MNIHALTVDVEEYFHVEALARVVDRDEWPRLERRVVSSTERCLALFARKGVRATFFVLGIVAKEHPALVRRIAAAGHELACHGHSHRVITSQSRTAFREDIRAARSALEDAAGVSVTGYRAPTFSIVESTRWALDVLREEGFRYDSSIYPIHHDRYGIPTAPRTPHRFENGLVEFPPATVCIAGRNFPTGGGGYLRLLPLAYNLWAMRRAASEGPLMVYLHPWELDPNQPRFPLPRLAAWRAYAGLDTMAARVASVLDTFKFAPAADVLRANQLLDMPQMEHVETVAST